MTFKYKQSWAGESKNATTSACVNSRWPVWILVGSWEYSNSMRTYDDYQSNESEDFDSRQLSAVIQPRPQGLSSFRPLSSFAPEGGKMRISFSRQESEKVKILPARRSFSPISASKSALSCCAFSNDFLSSVSSFSSLSSLSWLLIPSWVRASLSSFNRLACLKFFSKHQR